MIIAQVSLLRLPWLQCAVAHSQLYYLRCHFLFLFLCRLVLWVRPPVFALCCTTLSSVEKHCGSAYPRVCYITFLSLSFLCYSWRRVYTTFFLQCFIDRSVVPPLSGTSSQPLLWTLTCFLILFFFFSISAISQPCQLRRWLESFRRSDGSLPKVPRSANIKTVATNLASSPLNTTAIVAGLWFVKSVQLTRPRFPDTIAAHLCPSVPAAFKLSSDSNNAAQRLQAMSCNLPRSAPPHYAPHPYRSPHPHPPLPPFRSRWTRAI